MTTFMNYPGDSPVLNGDGAASPAFNIDAKNYVRISGLTVENYAPTTSGDGPDIGGAIQIYNSVGSEVDHNTVQNINVSSGQDAGIMVFNNTTAAMPYTVENNSVTDVTDTAGSGAEEDGIYVGGGSGYLNGGLIQGNVTFGNGKDGIRQECGDATTATVSIQDNITYGNQAYGIDVNDCYATARVLVTNNFSSGNLLGELVAKHSDNVTVENNTFVGKTSGLTDGVGFVCPLSGADCESGIQVLGDVPQGTLNGYGTVDGAVWNFHAQNNIFYGGSDAFDILEGAYGVMQGIGTPSNLGTFDYDDYYAAEYGTAYADEHLCNGSSCPGDGGYVIFSSVGQIHNGTGGTTWEQHGLSANPLFTNAGTGDYTLGSSSSLVTASSTGNALGADPAQLAGVGPNGNYSLADVNGS